MTVLCSVLAAAAMLFATQAGRVPKGQAPRGQVLISATPGGQLVWKQQTSLAKINTKGSLAASGVAGDEVSSALSEADGMRGNEPDASSLVDVSQREDGLDAPSRKHDKVDDAPTDTGGDSEEEDSEDSSLDEVNDTSLVDDTQSDMGGDSTAEDSKGLSLSEAQGTSLVDKATESFPHRRRRAYDPRQPAYRKGHKPKRGRRWHRHHRGRKHRRHHSLMDLSQRDDGLDAPSKEDDEVDDAHSDAGGDSEEEDSKGSSLNEANGVSLVDKAIESFPHRRRRAYDPRQPAYRKGHKPKRGKRWHRHHQGSKHRRHHSLIDLSQRGDGLGAPHKEDDEVDNAHSDTRGDSEEEKYEGSSLNEANGTSLVGKAIESFPHRRRRAYDPRQPAYRKGHKPNRGKRWHRHHKGRKHRRHHSLVDVSQRDDGVDVPSKEDDEADDAQSDTGGDSEEEDSDDSSLDEVNDTSLVDDRQSYTGGDSEEEEFKGSSSNEANGTSLVDKATESFPHRRGPAYDPRQPAYRKGHKPKRGKRWHRHHKGREHRRHHSVMDLSQRDDGLDAPSKEDDDVDDAHSDTGGDSEEEDSEGASLNEANGTSLLDKAIESFPHRPRRAYDPRQPAYRKGHKPKRGTRWHRHHKGSKHRRHHSLVDVSQRDDGLDLPSKKDDEVDDAQSDAGGDPEEEYSEGLNANGTSHSEDPIGKPLAGTESTKILRLSA